MRRFGPILARLNEQLVLPQPLKYRVLNEIAADLEDTFEAYIAQGLGEAEAEEKALTKIAANEQVIEQLIEIHETPVRKMLRKLSDTMQSRLEVSVWICLLFTIGVLLARMLLSSDSFAGSVFNWLAGGMLVGMFGISISKYYELYIKKEHDVTRIHRGMSLLIFISCLTIISGTLGFFVELRESVQLWSQAGPYEFNDMVISYMMRSFTAISFSYATAITGAVLWLIMTLKVLTIEDQEHAFILQSEDYTGRKLS